MLEITAKQGSAVTRKWQFKEDPNVITIGRKEKYNDNPVDIPLEGKNVSALHAAIIKNIKNKYLIRDFGSRNGIKVNGEGVFRCLLYEKDEIEIGSFILTCKLPDRSANSSPPMDEKSSDKRITEFNIVPESYIESLDAKNASGEKYARSTHSKYATEGIKQIKSKLRYELREPFDAIFRLIHIKPKTDQLLKEFLLIYLAIFQLHKIYIALTEPDDNQTIRYIVMNRGVDKPPVLKSMHDKVFGEGEAYFSGNMLAGVPLKKNGITFGILYLESKEDFSDPEKAAILRSAEKLSSQIDINIPPGTVICDHKANNGSYKKKDSKNLVNEFEWQDTIVGSRSTLDDFNNRIKDIAKDKNNVLILGEMGTGKELVATAIHKISERVGEFVPVPISLYEKTWLEDELFGMERNGRVQKIGAFERADKGTIFLDEIGDLKLDHQVKILRVIQEGQFKRMGGRDNIEVDVKIVSATNKPLRDMIKNGAFRDDLFFRLDQHEYNSIPLRDRKEDLPFLLYYFLDQKSNQAKTISRKAMDMLWEYDWPGNVREVKNATIKADNNSGERIILFPIDFPPEIQASVTEDFINNIFHDNEQIESVDYSRESKCDASETPTNINIIKKQGDSVCDKLSDALLQYKCELLIKICSESSELSQVVDKIVSMNISGLGRASVYNLVRLLREEYGIDVEDFLI